MSSDLIWTIVRQNNCYLVKRNGVVFSREPRNLTNKHSPKFSGLGNTKTVGVEAITAAADTKSTFTLAVSTKKGSIKVNSIKKNSRDANKSIIKYVKSYAPTLAKPAAARFSQLSKASKRTVTPVVAGAKTRRSFVKKN